MTKTELLKEYNNHLILKGHSKTTIKIYLQRANIFIDYAQRNSMDITKVGITEAEDYQKHLTLNSNKYKAKSIIQYINSIINFYEFLRENKVILTNPFKEIKKIRTPFKIPRDIPNEKKMNKLLNHLIDFNKQPTVVERFNYYRIHIIGEVMYSTGMRVSEAASLKIDDIDFDRGTIRVTKGKGGKDRTVILNEYANNILKVFIKEIRPYIDTADKSSHLLFGLQDVSLLGLMHRKLKKISREVKLEKFTSHYFRHALGYHLLKNGCSIRHIQSILGHARLRNTEIYTKVDKNELKDIIDKYHPRNIKGGNNET